MTNDIAPRDGNFKAVIQGVSSVGFNGTVNIAVNPSTHAMLVEASLTPVALQDVNLTEVAGVAIALGQTTMAASLPVTIASDQSAIHTIVDSGTLTAVTSITNPVAVTQSGTWNINNVSGTISLPTGASTLAEQQTQTTALGTLLTTSAFQARINTLGQKSMANSTPVVLASDQAAIPVTLTSTTITGTVTISGTVTANAGTNLNTSALNLETTQTSILTSLQLIDDIVVSQGTALGSTKLALVGGSVTTNAPTFTTGQINQLSLTTAGGLRIDLKDTASNTNNFNVNLAASAATVTVTATNLSTNISQIAGATAQSGSGTATGALRVELPTNGTGTIATVSTVTTVTTLTGTTTLTPGTAATNLGKAEDAGHTTGDTGVFALGVRNDALAATTNSNSDYTQLTTDDAGRQIVLPYAPTAARSLGNTSVAGTGSTQIIAADAALRIYVCSIQVSNTGSSTTLITIQDGSGGTALGYLIAPSGGGDNAIYQVPLRTTAATGLYFACGTSSTTVYISVQGYLAP